MKEIKNIDQLFKVAKEEKPQQTFEEVAMRFENSLTFISTISVSKAFLSKFINLNSLLVIIYVTSALVALFMILTPPAETVEGLSMSSNENQIVSNNKQPENAISENPEQQIQDKQSSFVIPISTDVERKGNSTESFVKTKKTNITSKSAKETLSFIPATNKYKIEESKWIEPNTEKEFSADLIKEEDTPNLNSANSMILQEEESTYATEQINLENSDSTYSISEIISEKEVVYLLSRTDNQQSVNSFVKTIQAYGIQTDLSISKRIKGNINKLTLQLDHNKGLDWRIRLQGFEQLEIKILLNEQQKPYGITYRLNQNGQFAEYLSLKHRGRSFHKFAGKGTKSKHQHTRRLNQN